ncbi:MAG: hypothetical protein SGI91_06135 [Alphaproteobacteria bacterium]|nr:hypothetical protein [Alphaproteobacteria bacterium]
MVRLGLVIFALIASMHAARADDAERDAREQKCIDNGWARIVDQAGRRLLWKGPSDRWAHGAIIVMHGGGGFADHWCHESFDIVATQVAFANAAVAQGFAVFTLDSTDRVSDREGRVCGKVWDDEVRNRANIDLPFLETLLRDTIPRLRPRGSGNGIFLTGLSSGGFMTVRAATHFDGLVTAFAPVSSGDPYGWHRVCDASLSPRRTVFGVGLDNETKKQIPEEGSCRASAYPNEMPWDTQKPPKKPPFKLFQHEKDGVHDFSCHEKVRTQLTAHGYPDAGPFVVRDEGRRRFVHHLWQSAYTQAVLDFFKSQAR